VIIHGVAAFAYDSMINAIIILCAVSLNPAKKVTKETFSSVCRMAENREKYRFACTKLVNASVQILWR
jgi:hypothetical protein